MQSERLRRTGALILIISLLATDICCYSTRPVALKEVHPKDPIVVQSADGSLYGLSIWRIDQEGNILGIGARFSPGATTADSLLALVTRQLGEPFRGTISSKDICRIYARLKDEWKTKEAVGYALLTPLAIAGVGFVVLLVLFLTSSSHG